jgi:transcriptional regulator with XRE-family HTH domain
VEGWIALEKRLRRRLASNVRALREERGLTLEAASADASMAWRHWQKIEAGEVAITLRTLAKLADALRVEPTDLLR